MTPRIPPVPQGQEPPEVAAAFDRHVKEYNARITNMKRTLGHSLEPFEAYMAWYPLYEGVKRILGDRLACLFAWSISESTECPLCSTYFRKAIIDAGESPEALEIADADQRVLDFGAAMGRNRGFVDDSVFAPVRERFSDREIVVLTAFAGIMIATNIFNNAIGTEIDEYLHAYRKPGQEDHR
ncbi:MAG: hypothetical protein JXA20_12190 [Spirochaetes bacterium]|nr:hypothetical protein [Spirochaetota bacterium]